MTGYTKAEAKASDAILADLSEVVYEASSAVEATVAPVHRAAGDKMDYRRRTPRWNMTFADALAAAAGSDAVAAYEVALDAHKAARAAVNAHEVANYKGWLRFFLVQGGHIHRSTGCSSLHMTTRIGWLPNLSGETEAEAVAEHGAMLCTKCFPSAPVEWTMGKAAPADQCPGSATWDYPRETARTGYCSGNYGVCSHCGERVTISSTGKMRKHKTPGK
ncbi:hypothetical protein I5H08_gp063 [Mycobacterium phage Yuna]|uniref:Uncharacterized protein n=1 Tax=Mycobacterium phage Yuna TaxID=2599885 RepID=A0A5J6TH39_9CAUD|nr:hypothetical protein I5H08_gp063 [Mycobacterium phage Yuna]QFG09424.1 hypothetical protein PBI_YUNA_42 [Mycobacterium phage Yuna]